MNKRYVNQYASVHTESIIEESTPHALIQMLMAGFLMQVNAAKGAITRGSFEDKSTHISRAISIVGGLIDGIDMERGGSIAENLNRLYEYINAKLFQASAENSIEMLDEVSELMRCVKEAWDAIPKAYR
ncbi:MAG: flagellar export chaperone FliS [Methylococcales bacterium]|nr:flagellar export chaperone FliS [Methylococcales bacterium]